MRLFLAEDELPARERLIEAVGRVAPAARIEGVAGSVREARAWLQRHPAPDLLLLDIQLADGLSLELFRTDPPAVPVIFTTAYDEFALAAFQAQAVDYLLKPIDETRLAQAFDKRARLARHFTGDLGALLARLQPVERSRFRNRLIGRQGARHVAIALDEVAFFISLDKSSHAVTHLGERSLVETPLSDLERELDPAAFFRANRHCIVSARAVKGFHAAGKGRLVLALHPDPGVEVAVSQERAGAFREWLAS